MLPGDVEEKDGTVDANNHHILGDRGTMDRADWAESVLVDYRQAETRTAQESEK